LGKRALHGYSSHEFKCIELQDRQMRVIRQIDISYSDNALSSCTIGSFIPELP
jgi:hypothetical protein